MAALVIMLLLLAAPAAYADCPPGWQLVSNTGPSARAYGAMAYDPAHQRVLCWGGYDGSNYTSDFWAWDGSTWSSIPSSGPPSFYQGFAAFDVFRSRFVLFVHGQTWEWDGASWSLMATSGPIDRVDASIAYDESRHVTVLFGGHDQNSDTDLGDTWEWDGVSWQMRSNVGPIPRHAPRMTYHSGMQRVVMFGGAQALKYDDQLWSWDGTSWSVLAANGPAGRQQPEFAYDRARNRLIVAGGEPIDGFFADTWEWDGADWNMAANPSPATDGGSTCYDAARGVIFQFGGYNSVGSLVRDSRTWAGGDLSVRMTTNTLPSGLGQNATLQVLASGTAPLTYQWRHAGVSLSDDGHYAGTSTPTLSIPTVALGDTGVYDVVVNSSCASVTSSVTRLCSNPTFTRQPFGLFGLPGTALSLSLQAGGCAVTSYQWLHDGIALLNDARISGVTTPALSITSTGASDAGVYQCLASNTAGSSLSPPATVELSSCVPTWTQKVVSAPPGVDDGAMTYDSFRHRVVLFGGRDVSLNYRSDTWEWDGTQWQLMSSAGPSPRWGEAMTYDAVRHRVVLFGGSDDTAYGLGDTWEWDGIAWVQRASSGPAPRGQPGMAFDGTRCVLFGGSLASSVAADTWAWDGTTWQQLATSGPPGRANHVMAYDPVRGRVFIFGGWSFANPRLSDAWTWDGTAWARIDRTGPTGREGAAAEFDPVRQRIVVFGGYAGGQSYSAETWEWDGTQWSKSLVPGGPAARFNPCLAFDSVRGEMVLFGGRLNNDNDPSDTWTRTGSGAVITQAPTDVNTSAGSDASFTVVAAGGSQLTYRWRKDGATLVDGGRVSGNSTATLTIASAQASDAGTYQVQVSGACGTVTASAQLDVPCSPARQINTQPTDVTVPLGSPASFQVTAVGCDPVTYQWRKDGVNIAGATSATFSIASVATGDAGAYSCLVSDGLGSTASAVATLNLQEPVLLSRTERIVSTTQAQVLWQTRSACTAVVQFGATTGLGTSMSFPTTATTGSAVLSRAPNSSLYYRIVLTDLSARTLTTSISQIVFPPSGARLSGRLIPSPVYVDWNGAGQGISIGASFQNVGSGSPGPVILDSATLNSVPARFTNGQPSSPRQVTPDLAQGATVVLAPDTVFSRAELNLPSGSSATATINVHWTDGLSTKTLQVKQRVRLP